MTTGNVAVVLVYEPATTKGRPLPLARVHDESIIVDAARAAIADAQARAKDMAHADQYLGEVEQAEVNRLRKVLALLIPGLVEFDRPTPVAVQ